jgi:hypothetical protein
MSEQPLPHEASVADDLSAQHYQHERYLGVSARRRSVSLYYAIKPILPRPLQLWLRRIYACRQAARVFPAWPIEPVLIEASHAQLRASLREDAGGQVSFIGYWPAPYRSAVVLTHDVEGPAGFASIRRLVEIERRYGFRSSWNFVAEDYVVPEGMFEWLRQTGCEIGLHGIQHDGKLFQSRAHFETDLPKIRSYMQSWGAVGFRSPATHRNSDWMHELGCLYDSSYPDTDPFEPQPGGCCSVLPFMFGDVVELPITMVQDHTLWEILRQDSTDVWRRKAAWIVANHGLVCVNTHPDYFTSERRFELYEELVAFLSEQPGSWLALPRDVARWWKVRAALSCETGVGGAQIVGPEAARAQAWLACDEAGEIVFEF